MLTFDVDTHTYRVRGKVVPGVTSVLAPLTDFSAVPPDVMRRASEFGKAVHAACELDDLDQLDEHALDPAIKPYLDAWRKFCAEHRVEWEWIEAPKHHPTLGYAGTPDRIGKVNGLLAVVDIKTTAALYPSVGPQLAAYAALSDPQLGFLMKRIAVQLKADGTYTAKTHDDPTDWPAFCSLLTLRNWCQRHAIKPTF